MGALKLLRNKYKANWEVLDQRFRHVTQRMASDTGAESAPKECSALSSLLDDHIERFLTGDKDVQDAALKAAKYIFDLGDSISLILYYYFAERFSSSFRILFEELCQRCDTLYVSFGGTSDTITNTGCT